MSKADQLYKTPFEEISDFRFDKGVVEVFEDMIERSVPGYSAILGMTGELAKQFSIANTKIYDLGCSLGGSSFSIAQQKMPEGVSLVAIDNSEAMIEKLNLKLAEQQNLKLPIEVRLQDIQEVDFQPSSFVVMNFTLQFVALEERLGLIQKIYDSLVPGGALLLSEKIKFADSEMDQQIVDLYHSFKKSMGYTELEISQKRTALENILLPETSETHSTRMANCGFTQVAPWFQCFNFCSFLAIKPGGESKNV
jgi:tRNA (cmo5U34)-methyltransferase